MSEKNVRTSFKNNAVGKLVPIHLINAGLPQTSNSWKSKVWGSAIKWEVYKNKVAYRRIGR